MSYDAMVVAVTSGGAFGHDQAMAFARYLAGMPPLTSLMIIVLVAQLAEDLAVLGAAILVGMGDISVAEALIASFVGIWSGDLWLFGAGRFARRWQWLRLRIGQGRLERAGRWLSGRYVLILVVARAVPFMRLPVFLGAGYFGLSRPIFFLTTALACGVWTVFLFTAALGLLQLVDGLSPADQSLILAGVAALVLFGPRFVSRIRARF